MKKMSKLEILHLLRDCVFDALEDSKARLSQYTFEVNKSVSAGLSQSYEYWRDCFREEFEHKSKLTNLLKMIEKRIDKYYQV